VKEENVQPIVSEGTKPQASSWEEIDSEMNCSSREVCLGYGGLSSLEGIRRLRNGGGQMHLPRR